MANNEITEEGAINLACAVLVFTYKDYYRALKQVMRWRKVHKELQPIEDAWQDYHKTAKYYNKIKFRKNLTEEERKVIKSFPHLKEPRRLNKREKCLLGKYNTNYLIMLECEYFYRSANFKLYTLNADIDPEEVIDTIRKDAHYVGE